MPKNLFDPNIAQSTVSNLKALSPVVPCKEWPVELDPSTPEYKAGMALVYAGSGKTFKLWTTEDAIDAILVNRDPVDATDPDEAIGGLAAFTGEFNKTVVEEASGQPITDLVIYATAIQRNIFIAPFEEAPEYYENIYP